ncbi:hypothetical protein N8473_08895 [Amylibacter sp.]|nr:hypothetical protein [Amylibacter sp.]
MMSLPVPPSNVSSPTPPTKVSFLLPPKILKSPLVSMVVSPSPSKSAWNAVSCDLFPV